MSPTQIEDDVAAIARRWKDKRGSLIMALHALQDRYGYVPRDAAMNLGERARRVFASVQAMCEWRLGRSPAPGETAMPELGIPVSGLVECLRKIQKSVPRWSQRGGRQGYSQFVSQYIR